MSTCDNTSVGVLIERDNRYLMFERQTFPPGIAPPAGHVDAHGAPEQAATAETREEVGLTVTGLTLLDEVWLPNRCRRQPGPSGVGHQWTLFRAEVSGVLDLDPREARSPLWCDPSNLQWLADNTLRGSLLAGHGLALEPAWCLLLDRLGVIRLGGALGRALRLAQTEPEEAR
ncbi:hypothetical protein GCM10010172_35160 [Paractinoplanes ferrugineus]|uniref:Nudix hydrolase domain-containing protein n=1 Tax=Paractinoplanes ferrugineus TaxID=113564 RepID=A0A919MJ67_9ACTN|nr:NUDIX hydrolase [Actinoplanes ferrugineus]GIE16774.1 hypothetical protein Afe05nite_86140 [Actinoplanes ferrugineus]